MPRPGAVEPHDADALDELQDTHLCEDCEEVLSDFFCNVCQCSLCGDCWDRQPAHRRKRLAPGALPHEKTELSLANRIQTVFSFSGDERTFERLHKDDEITAWFGLEREMKDGRPFMFRDHGRFAELATSSRRTLFKQRGHLSIGGHDDANCVPSIVSFVGQTGAGKSTLIKLLIQFNQWSGLDHGFPSPIPGINGRDLPTSEDVHLYADPLTMGSEYPMIYADSEGLDGGEREPLAATLRKTRERRESESFGSESDYSTSRHTFTEREVAWMTSKTNRTRQFAAAQLYPRILFAFSDVVVFVHRNPRAIEGVMERLLDWGSVAIETTYNQPILPFAILALNATENDADPCLWDVHISTTLLLESLANTVDKNVVFSKYADLWRKRGKIINTLEDLMLCYYSSLRIVRLPTNGRPKLIEEQAQKLYLEIERGSRLARNFKTQTRMLLNAFELQAYLNHAFDHFCATIDAPFDFVQCSYLNSRLSTTFGESILALARDIAWKKPRPKASTIFDKLGRLIASSIMLDCIRSKLKGTTERMFAQYVPQIDAAMKEFGERHLPCEFYVHGTIPPHMQAHMTNMNFQQSMRAAAVIMRCANVRSGHAAKGHQLSDGRVFARGSYESSFSFEKNRKQVLDNIYVSFYCFMDEVSQLSRQGHSRIDAASAIHRDRVLAAHYPPTETGDTPGLRHTTFCICCLFGMPEAMLPCGHMLCRDCLKAYAESKSKTLVEVQICPLETNHDIMSEPRTIYLRPDAAGVRVLSLNNGGIRSIIQIEILKLIEDELQGKIPIQYFFDMIIGEGTGGVLALGLVSRGWSLNDCEKYLKSIFEKTFIPANVQRFPTVSLLQMKSTHSKYRTKTLDEGLTSMFPVGQRIIDLSVTDHPVAQSTKVAVLASSATGRKVLFSNYRQKSSSKLPYTIYPVTNYAAEPKVRDIARASMAHPDLFKPFIDPRLGNLFFQKDMSENFLIEVAQNECQAIYSGLQRDFPDVFVSLGCGRTKRLPPASIASNDTKTTKDTNATRKTKMSKRTITEKERDSQSTYTEDSWDAYAAYPRPQFISLNPTLDALPEFDDIASIPHLQQVIQDTTDPVVIRKLVAQLFATLFYAEMDDPVQDSAASEVLIPVRIYTRLLPSTPEIQAVGRLLKFGAYRNSEFAFWEEGYGPQQFPITSQVLDAMIREKQFTMFRIMVPLWQSDAVVHGVLRLEGGEEYPLSGFPRRLREGRGKGPKRRDIERPETPKMPSWSAPKSQDMPPLGAWSSELSVRSLTLTNRPSIASHRGVALSNSPGPVEVEGDAPPYRKRENGDSEDDNEDEDEEEFTALPRYTR